MWKTKTCYKSSWSACLRTGSSSVVIHGKKSLLGGKRVISVRPVRLSSFSCVFIQLTLLFLVFPFLLPLRSSRAQWTPSSGQPLPVCSTDLSSLHWGDGAVEHGACTHAAPSFPSAHQPVLSTWASTDRECAGCKSPCARPVCFVPAG